MNIAVTILQPAMTAPGGRALGAKKAADYRRSPSEGAFGSDNSGGSIGAGFRPDSRGLRRSPINGHGTKKPVHPGVSVKSGKLGAARLRQLGKKGLSQLPATIDGSAETAVFGFEHIGSKLAKVIQSGKAIGTGIRPSVDDSVKVLAGLNDAIAKVAPHEQAMMPGNSGYADTRETQHSLQNLEMTLPSETTEAGTVIVGTKKGSGPKLVQDGQSSEANQSKAQLDIVSEQVAGKIELPVSVPSTIRCMLDDRQIGNERVSEPKAVNPQGSRAAGTVVAQGKSSPRRLDDTGTRSRFTRPATGEGAAIAAKATGLGQQDYSGALNENSTVQASNLASTIQSEQYQEPITGIASNNQAATVIETSDESSLTNQIAQAFKPGSATTDGEMVIRLNPPELGRVRVELQSEGKDVRAVLHADNPRTVAELQQEAPALIQRLAENGVEVRRMDVVLNQQSHEDSSYTELQGDHAGQQQEYADNSQGSSQSDRDAGVSEDSNPVLSGYMQNQVSDSSINVWM